MSIFANLVNKNLASKTMKPVTPVAQKTQAVPAAPIVSTTSVEPVTPVKLENNEITITTPAVIVKEVKLEESSNTATETIMNSVVQTKELLPEPPPEVIVDLTREVTVPDESVTVSIIKNHQNSQMNQLLKGVTGEFRDGNFTFDPAYKELSYFFTLTPKGMVDNAMTVVDMTFPNKSIAKEFSVNAIKANGESWNDTYERVIGHLGTQSSSMIVAEKNHVSDNVIKYIESSGLKEFQVPVSYEAIVSELEDHSEANTEQELAALSQPLTLSITIGDEPIELSSDIAPIEQTEMDDEVRDHDGAYSFDVKGFMSVLASSPENAKTVAQFIVKMVGENNFQNLLTLKPSSIDNVTLTPKEEYERESDY